MRKIFTNDASYGEGNLCQKGKVRRIAPRFNCSYIFTDINGELLALTGKRFKKKGFSVRVLNLVETDHSLFYNPFCYFYKKEDVFSFVADFVKNTNLKVDNGISHLTDYNIVETHLLEALFLYVWLKCPKEEQNLKSVIDLLLLGNPSDLDKNQKSRLDILFEEMEGRKGEYYLPVQQYNLYKEKAGKKANGILVSVAVRLSVFQLKEIEKLTMEDTLHLEELTKKKTAVYIVLPDWDTTFHLLASMVYSQLPEKPCCLPCLKRNRRM